MESIFSSRLFYEVANVFFYVFHVVLILFNVIGWIWKGTRKLNLLTLGLTAFSWFALGIFYGWGYCFLTDWHWQVRLELGYPVKSASYIHFLVTSMFSIKVSESLVDVMTVVMFFAALPTSLFLNVRDLRRRRRKSATTT